MLPALRRGRFVKIYTLGGGLGRFTLQQTAAVEACALPWESVDGFGEGDASCREGFWAFAEGTLQNWVGTYRDCAIRDSLRLLTSVLGSSLADK
mmetsp:Transcript_5283/g.15608  ORF Transcript_5283/g.15608 Transcript_5283/m.15608 type:complete len:94 (+) Transcript_5283:451-732(+)